MNFGVIKLMDLLNNMYCDLLTNINKDDILLQIDF